MRERGFGSENNRACRNDVVGVDEARRVCGDRERWESLISSVLLTP